MSRRSEARAWYVSAAAGLALAALLAEAVRADEPSDPYAAGRRCTRNGVRLATIRESSTRAPMP